MARKPRFNLAVVSQYVIQRGNNPEPCFYGVGDYYQKISGVGNELIQFLMRKKGR